jgi:hypothetical protein
MEIVFETMFRTKRNLLKASAAMISEPLPVESGLSPIGKSKPV